MKTNSLSFSLLTALRHTRAWLLLLALSGSAFGSILNSQEQQIASMMISNSQQGRPSLTLDPILAGVARARAMDMAKRNYFDHVNPDGVAANYLVRKAGYKLPDWWGTDPKANYIESIAGGFATAQDVWTGWMNSPEHRTHILGLNAFYATETSYGIGYYYDSGSTYKNYWVIITAPPAPAANLAITSPASGTTVSGSSVTIMGTALAGSGATQIVYRVENAGGTGSFASATGLTDWSATAALTTGANTIRVRSLNNSGVAVAEATITVISSPSGSVTVAVNGNGSVTKGFLGTTSRLLGSRLTVAAVPAAGYVFTGWSGDATATTPALTFTMQDGLSFTANFIVNPFVALRGGYNGLISSNDHPGMLSLAMVGTGAFSGAVTFDGVRYAVKGLFDAMGAATVTIPRRNNTTLTAQLQLDLTDGSDEITGTISDGTFTAGISADRATFSASHPAPQAGHYTVVLAAQPNTSTAQMPQGSGFAVLSVNTSGLAIITGRLADNTAFAQATTISKNGAMPLFLTLVKATGSVTGVVTFRATNVSDLDGTLIWNKPGAARALYPQGFTAQLPVIGSSYTAPARNRAALDLTSATVGLSEGNLANPLTFAVNLEAKQRITMANAGSPNFSGAITAANGTMWAGFSDPVTHAKRVVAGVVLQKQNAVYGYFLGANQIGNFALEANAFAAN